mmetsp:Transcript_23862/g.50277  ORF Transcript_23862/g.50277 Transcript_23862/m.50277 type:complete len:97 (-) Transcript_23862:756-1046(-)
MMTTYGTGTRYTTNRYFNASIHLYPPMKRITTPYGTNRNSFLNTVLLQAFRVRMHQSVAMQINTKQCRGRGVSRSIVRSMDRSIYRCSTTKDAWEN